MIGRLCGRLAMRAEDHVLIDVGGVGFVVHVSQRTLAALPAPGGQAMLWTDLLVREDLLQLYGFTTLAEREWYRLLTSVQGVGSKVSLAILGTLGADGVSRAIALGDWTAIKAARGVGAKTAQRIVNELKDKAPAVMAMGTASGEAPAAGAPAPAAPIDDDVVETPAPAPPAPAASAQADALSALVNLGYAPAEAAAAVAAAQAEAPGLDTSGLIRAALKRLAPAG